LKNHVNHIIHANPRSDDLTKVNKTKEAINSIKGFVCIAYNF